MKRGLPLIAVLGAALLAGCSPRQEQTNVTAESPAAVAKAQAPVERGDDKRDKFAVGAGEKKATEGEASGKPVAVPALSEKRDEEDRAMPAAVRREQGDSRVRASKETPAAASLSTPTTPANRSGEEAIPPTPPVLDGPPSDDAASSVSATPSVPAREPSPGANADAPSTPSPQPERKPAPQPERKDVPLPKPKSAPPAEAPRKTGRLAIIIDDVGMSVEQLTPFLNTQAPLTYAIIPDTKQAKRCLSLIRAQGRLPMLHLPMEPVRRKDLLPKGSITVDLESEEIERRVRRHLDELPGVRGVNNHMGSLATQDSRVMESVLSVVKQRGLFFVDSKTADVTAVTPIVQRLGIPHASRTGEFLDDGGNTSRTYDILLDLGREAMQRGHAIGIGHPHSGTAKAIARALPELEAMGVKIVPVNELLR